MPMALIYTLNNTGEVTRVGGLDLYTPRPNRDLLLRNRGHDLRRNDTGGTTSQQEIVMGARS